MADVQDVIARGVAEAQARGVQATIAVTDRVGNVLGVFRMGLPHCLLYTSPSPRDLSTSRMPSSA